MEDCLSKTRYCTGSKESLKLWTMVGKQHSDDCRFTTDCLGLLHRSVIHDVSFYPCSMPLFVAANKEHAVQTCSVLAILVINRAYKGDTIAYICPLLSKLSWNAEHIRHIHIIQRNQ